MPNWISGSLSVFGLLISIFKNIGTKLTKLAVWLMLGMPSE